MSCEVHLLLVRLCTLLSSPPLSTCSSAHNVFRLFLLGRLGKESEAKRRKEEQKERAKKRAARDAQHEVIFF